MKALLNISIILCLLTSASFAQDEKTELIIRGKSDDPAVIAKKKALEAKGYKIKVLPKNASEETDDVLGDKIFVQKYTGQKLPSFELKDMEGNLMNSEELVGKFVHINFWSVTCKPCIQEFPELNELKEKYQSDDFVFLAFAPESEEKVQKILEKYPLDYRIIANAQAYYDQLGIDGYPKNFFINEQGTIVEVMDGTKFKGVKKDGKFVMIPDNFERYDQAIQAMR